MKRSLILLSIIALFSCTDPRGAERVLDAAGYTNIRITGYRCFKCSDDDSFHTGFKATGQNGQEIKGTVCSGICKGHTIRID